MSQAKPPLPKPGEADLRAVVNQVFTDIGTASGALTADNLREEGLDEYSLTAQSEATIYFTATGPDLNSNTAFAIMQVDAADVKTTGFTVGIDEEAVVRAEFQLINNDPVPGVPAGRVVNARLVKSLATVVTPLVGTTMILSGDQPQTGCCVMDAVLPAGVYDFIAVQSKIDAAGNYFPGYASIIIELFRRTTP